MKGQKTGGRTKGTPNKVTSALQQRIRAVQATADECFENLTAIANAKAGRIRASDIIRANTTLLKAHGRLEAPDKGSSRIQVTIGFLMPHSPPQVQTIELSATDLRMPNTCSAESVEVMTSQPQALTPGDSDFEE